jgi:hypothetical protein
MQPYQKASEQIQDQAEQYKRMGTKAAITAGSLASSAALGAKVLPFLSNFIPRDIAMKGISKVSPALGGFVNKAIGTGHSEEDVMDFVKNKIVGAEQSNEPAKDERNVIEKRSKFLFDFLKDKIGRGLSPFSAASNAKAEKKYRQEIQELEEQNKTPFENIVESVFGGALPKNQNQQPMQPDQMQSNMQAPGQGQEKLMAILQQIQASRGK